MHNQSSLMKFLPLRGRVLEPCMGRKFPAWPVGVQAWPGPARFQSHIFRPGPPRPVRDECWI